MSIRKLSSTRRRSPPPLTANMVRALLRCWRTARLSVELHITPCIVTHPPGSCDGLVNPANEQLVGTQFTPSEANRNLQGASEAGIIYPPQAPPPPPPARGAGDPTLRDSLGRRLWTVSSANSAGLRCGVRARRYRRTVGAGAAPLAVLS